MFLFVISFKDRLGFYDTLNPKKLEFQEKEEMGVMTYEIYKSYYIKYSFESY